MRTMCAVTCPHLAGSMEGAVCRVEDRKIKDMEGAFFSLCIGRHYEACPHYFMDLRRMALQTLTNPGA